MSRNNLYMFRCEQRLTKKAMAKKTGVSRTTYSLIENGERDGSQEFWDTLQTEFNIPDSKMFNLMKKIKERKGQCDTKEK